MSEKSKRIFVFFKALLVLLTLVYPFFMVIMTGAGLVCNHESYGEKITNTGVCFVVSGLLMTCGAFMCMLRRRVYIVVSLFMSSGGFILCMAMLKCLISHADNHGWVNAFTLIPVSDMYRTRIIPVIIPFVMSVIIALVNLFSCGYDGISEP